jgi:O-antigen/teichoic acid export membrane protein
MSSDEIYRLKVKAMKALMLVVTPAVLIGITITEPFLVIWVGAAIATVSAPVAHILYVGFWANALAHIPYVSLQGSGRPKVTAMVHLGELLPYAAVLAVALHIWGIRGAALAWSLRVGADAIVLFALDRSFRPAAAMFSVPALLVLMAAVVAMACPMDAAARWIALGVVNMIGLVWWFVCLPVTLRQVRDTGITCLAGR